MATKATKEAVQSAREALKGALSVVDGQLTVTKEAEEKLLNTFLTRHNVSREVFEALQTAGLEAESAVHLEAAQVAAEAFKADEKLEKITGEVNFGAGKVNVAVRRSQTFPDPKNKGQTVTKHLRVSTDYEISGGLGKGALGKEIASIWESVNS